MVKRVASAIAAGSALCSPVLAQFAGRTCGPEGCNPIPPPPSAEATAFVRTVCRDHRVLVLKVTLLNEDRVAVPGDPTLSAIAATDHGEAVRLSFTATQSSDSIAPGAYQSWVDYRASMPAALSGNIHLRVSGSLPIDINLDNLNECPMPQ